MNDLSPDDEDRLSDDELANLERAMESGVTTEIESVSHLRQQFRSMFEQVDRIAAPIRRSLESMDSPPVIDDYEGLVEIARGGMGVVYRGLHKRTQRYDAVKVLRPDRLFSPTNEIASLLRQQFLRESQLAARVAHEHIVPVYEVGETSAPPWFSMQFVEGCSLHELTKDVSVSTERIVRYIERIARAIDVVHQHGILHGDIKPQNILIENHTDRPMLSDFGLAAFESASTASPTLGVAGTPAYMAPELANASIHAKTRTDFADSRTISSDIYSLGATLWAAISRSSPCFENRTPQEQLVDVASGRLRFHQESYGIIPPAVMRIIRRCVSPSPEQRYSTAGDLADDLANWLDGPRWNRHYPKLRQLLCLVVAPALLLSGITVQILLAIEAAQHWVWLTVFAGYGPLFGTFLASQQLVHRARRAHRELWSIWIGHLCASASCAVALQILFHPDFHRIVQVFYPFWAAISALVFFAKSGNFWSGYRWLGFTWSLIAVLMAATNWAPVLFSAFAAMTCVVIATMDRSFLES